MKIFVCNVHIVKARFWSRAQFCEVFACIREKLVSAALGLSVWQKIRIVLSIFFDREKSPSIFERLRRVMTVCVYSRAIPSPRKRRRKGEKESVEKNVGGERSGIYIFGY